MYVSLSAIQAKPEHREELFEGMKEQALNVVTHSRGCLYFNIVQDGDDPNRIWLYEVFTNADDFKAHTQMPYSLAWGEKSRDWREQDAPRAGRGSYTIFPTDSELQQILTPNENS